MVARRENGSFSFTRYDKGKPDASPPSAAATRALSILARQEGLTAYPIVELKAPPSRSTFWPTMKPDEALHRKAQASPNSAGSPTRPVGFDWPRFASISSKETFWRRASYSMPERSRSVRNGPGSRPLIVTLYLATWRASPAQNPVSPARAPLLMPRIGIGDLTDPEVMLTMR